MIADDYFKGPPSDLMMCSESFILNPNNVNRSLASIVSHLPLAESST